VWDKKNENNLLILKGDTSIVNCLQPHPSEFMLATSGIDHDVKLWTPLSDVKYVLNRYTFNENNILKLYNVIEHRQ